MAAVGRDGARSEKKIARPRQIYIGDEELMAVGRRSRSGRAGPRARRGERSDLIR